MLKQDAEPAIYVYQQVFEKDGERKSVRGFTCAVKLADYSENVILPHEWTLARPKSDLAVLIRQVKANLDCVYGLYADPDRVLDAVMDKAMAGAPIEEAVDRNGVISRFWAVTDPAEIEKVTSFMAGKQVAIADGHHRYETALAYRDEMREAGEQAGAAPSPQPSPPGEGAAEFDYVHDDADQRLRKGHDHLPDPPRAWESTRRCACRSG